MTMTPRNAFLLSASLNGFLGVAAGAFGAHALKSRLPADLLAVFETGARYQLVHAVALLGVAWLAEASPGKLPRTAGACFTLGTLLFSGSLYALAFSGVRALGAITPLGGVALLAGWALLGVAAVRRR